jgi:mRNA-degrading endonuclease YafQ of YafQ-DinJ toxin-antitoxin module
MRRTLLRSAAFVRASKRLLKKNPDVAEAFRVALERLAEDASDARLKTHRLKGDLDGAMACSVNHELRIVFEFVVHDGAQAILLRTVGTHEQVY